MADTLFGGAALASNFDDDNEQRRRGHDATSGTDGTLTALYYCVPSTGVPFGAGSVAKMYVVNNAGELQCEVDLQAEIPAAPAGWTRIDASLFKLAGTPTGPIDWPSGTRFRGWVATVGDGTPFGKVLFTDPGTFPKVSTPDGCLSCSTGLYGGGAVPPETIPGIIGLFWDFDFEFTATPTSVDGTFQAIAGPAALSGAGQLIDPGVIAAAAGSSALAAAGALINPGVVAIGISGFNLAVTGTAVNAGTFQSSAPLPVLALHETAFIEPGLGTPSGSALVPAPSGSVLVPVPSGRP